MIQESASLTNPLTPLGDHPLMTIVVASYNQEDYIEETIASVLDQDYDSIELIVIDGGSTDDTVKIIRKYESDPRLRWLSEPDDGPNDALDKGLKMANGDLVGLQLSSDTYKPGAIREAVEEFAADPQLAFVGGVVQEMDEESRPTDEAWRIGDQRFCYSVDSILTLGIYPGIQATFFRRDIALAMGGYHPEFKWTHIPFFLYYMLEASKLEAHSLYVPTPWANYRRHPNALSKKLATKDVGLKLLLERNLACKEVSKRYKDYLTARQVRELRRHGYLREFRYRVGVLRQFLPAIPAFLGYVRFGGTLVRQEFRPKSINMMPYLTRFIWERFSHRTNNDVPAGHSNKKE